MYTQYAIARGIAAHYWYILLLCYSFRRVRRSRFPPLNMDQFIILAHELQYVEINIKSVLLRDILRVDMPNKKIHSSSFNVSVRKLKSLTAILLVFPSSMPLQRETLAYVGNLASHPTPSERLDVYTLMPARSYLYYRSTTNLDSRRVSLVLI